MDISPQSNFLYSGEKVQKVECLDNVIWDYRMEYNIQDQWIKNYVNFDFIFQRYYNVCIILLKGIIKLFNIILCYTGPVPQKTICVYVSRTWRPLENVPNFFGTPSGTQGLVIHPQDIAEGFQGRFKHISKMFWENFKDFLGRFGGCSGHLF